MTPPPKLVAPMSRKARKISPSVTLTGDGAGSPARTPSLMSLGGISLETIDDARLRGAHGDPVAREILHGQEELLDATLHLRVQVVLPVELRLERVLADERRVVAPGPPQAEVVLRDHALAEVELAEVEEHLLDDGLVHQLDLIIVRPLQGGEAGEEAHEGGHARAVGELDLAQAELRIVRVEHAHATQLVLEGQGLRLELDLVDPGNMRAHIEVGGLLRVGMPELEDDFRVTHGKAVFVQDAPAQDEGVVVEAEVRGVQENHFPDLGPLAFELTGGEIDVGLLRRVLHDLGEIEEPLLGGEAVRLENDLALEVMHFVEWVTVAVVSLLELGNQLRLVVVRHRGLPYGVTCSCRRRPRGRRGAAPAPDGSGPRGSNGRPRADERRVGK